MRQNPHLGQENEEDWLQLLVTWLDGYQNPVENSLLYTFVFKVAQAEWQRLLRYHELKALDLVARYLTAAERKFQREYRLLEHHWKSHAAQAALTGRNRNHDKVREPIKPAEQPEFSSEMPEIRFINNETGESIDSYDGNHYPPPPN